MGNLQIYVIELLRKLLSMATLEYRISPVFQSMAIFVRESDFIFKWVMSDLFKIETIRR